MLQDRYGLALSTQSAAARDAYVEGCDLLLSVYPGAQAAFERAIAADPGFALAHVGRARAVQTLDVPAARVAIKQAATLTGGLSAREAGHVEVFSRVLGGPGDIAFAAVRAHLAEWPRDAMVLSTSSGQIGLIGLSGRPAREQELADFLGDLAGAYGDDWWFESSYAMALSEVGQLAAARPVIERAMARNPRNANGAHSLAHLYYELGEQDAAMAFMRAFLADYPREGTLHGHISWHLALHELQDGNIDEGLRLYTDAFAADLYCGPGLLKLVDAASFLWRAELAGHESDAERWRLLHDFAHALVPRPGLFVVDWHVALADAVAGDSDGRVQAMEALVQAGRYACGTTVPSLARGVAAFRRRDFAGAIAEIEPMLGERARIGGSRAQVDLVEFTLLRAYLEEGRHDDARRLLAARRPGPSALPVAGLAALH